MALWCLNNMVSKHFVLTWMLNVAIQHLPFTLHLKHHMKKFNWAMLFKFLHQNIMLGLCLGVQMCTLRSFFQNTKPKCSFYKVVGSDIIKLFLPSPELRAEIQLAFFISKTLRDSGSLAQLSIQISLALWTILIHVNISTHFHDQLNSPVLKIVCN